MIPRELEPELMDTPEEARDYDEMDHSVVNRAFASDYLSTFPSFANPVLDVGTGTAQIPIELCRQSTRIQVTAVDLADEMLVIARRNVERSEYGNRITIQKVNGRDLSYSDGSFGSVISNSIIHHIPNPIDCFREMVRVCRSGGALFIRDLLRPDSVNELERLVNLHASGANNHQRALFANSLHAALTLDELRAIATEIGFAPDAVRQTSDRHWTFSAIKHD